MPFSIALLDPFFPFITVRKDCPQGWLATKTSCFKAEDAKKTWIDAVADCQATPNAQLAFDFGLEEATFLGSKLPFFEEYWVGIRNR